MIIKGIVVDIESISRFRMMPFVKHKNFYKRIFTEREIMYCLSKMNPYQHFAVRFCAKEALSCEKRFKNHSGIILCPKIQKV